MERERERERETSSYQSLMGVHSFAQVLLRTQVFARTLSLALSVFFFTYVSKQIYTHTHISGVRDAEFLMLTTALGTTVPRYIHSDAKVHIHTYTYIHVRTMQIRKKEYFALNQYSDVNVNASANANVGDKGHCVIQYKLKQ